MSGQPKDGGPAYPVAAIQHSRNSEWQTEYGFDGMSLRDYFAGQALLTMDHAINKTGGPVELIAGACYEIADAMLAEREKGGES